MTCSPMNSPGRVAWWAQHRGRDAEARVGALGAGHRLEQQVDGRALAQRLQLGGDVGEHARLGGDAEAADDLLQRVQQPADRGDGLGDRVDPDQRVATAVQEAVQGGGQHAVHRVGGVVGLHPAAEHPALAHGGSAAGDGAQRCGGHHEVLVAHELGHRRGDAGGQRPGQAVAPGRGEAAAEHELAQLAHRQRAQLREARPVVPTLDQLRHVVLDQARVGDLAQGHSGQGELGRDPLHLGVRGDPGELVAGLLLVRLGQQLAQVGEGEGLAADARAIAHQVVK
jgi:hypothetical protein